MTTDPRKSSNRLQTLSVAASELTSALTPTFAAGLVSAKPESRSTHSRHVGPTLNTEVTTMATDHRKATKRSQPLMDGPSAVQMCTGFARSAHRTELTRTKTFAVTPEKASKTRGCSWKPKTHQWGLYEVLSTSGHSKA